MIVKFFSAQSKTKKYASGGTGVQDYLLGKNFIDGQNPSRENAKVLQGDPNLTTELINGLNFSVPYCSGCLSFDGDESERVTEAMKIELMEEFEKTLFANHNDRISGYWVEHTDKTDPNNGKQRLELNFVFANVDLVTGKFLPSYYHQADLGRVNAYKEIMNYKHDLTDPSNRLAVSTRISNTHPAKLKDLKGTIDEQLTAAVNEGKVNNRADVLNFVKELGYEIVGSKKGSISIKNPDPSNSRNVRLEGAYYTKDFDGKAYLADKTRLESTANPQMPKYQVYKASKLIDIHESQIEYDWGMTRRQEFLDKRYPAPTPPPADALIKKPTDEEVQRYANNFRAALKDIANTRSRILEIRTANESIIATIRGTDQSIEVTKNDIGNTDSDIENAKQRITDTERVIERTKSDIASTKQRIADATERLATRPTPFDPPKPMPVPAAEIIKPKTSAPAVMPPPRPAPKPIPPFVSLADFMHLEMSVSVTYQNVNGWARDETKTGIDTFANCVQTLANIESGKYKKPVVQEGRYPRFESGVITPKEILSVVPEQVIASRNLNEHEKLVLQNIENQLKGSDGVQLVKDIALLPVAELAAKYPALGVDVALLNVNEIRPRTKINVGVPPPEPVGMADIMDHDQHQKFTEDTIKAFSGIFRTAGSKQKFREDMAKDRPAPEPIPEKADTVRADVEPVEPPAEVPRPTAEIEKVTPTPVVSRLRPRGP